MDRFITKAVKMPRGITLLEMLMAVGVVSLLTLVSYTVGVGGQQTSNTLKAKSYLLSIQAIQSQVWLERGSYMSLQQLAVTPPDGIWIKDNTAVERRDISFNFSVTLTEVPSSSACRTLVVTEERLLPTECW